MSSENSSFPTPSPEPTPARTQQGATGRSVPASHGLRWLQSGWALFCQSPLQWVLLTIMFCALWFVLSLIPLISVVILPVLNGGVMLACERQQRRGKLAPADLFAGFGPHLAALMVLGLVSLAAAILTLLPLAGVVGFGAASGLLSGKPDPAHVTALLEGFGISMLLLIAASLLMCAALWFAPALVTLRGLSAFDAMKASFSASWRNLGSGLVYALASAVLMFLAALPLGLGLLVMLPVFMASIHASTHDIFPAE